MNPKVLNIVQQFMELSPSEQQELIHVAQTAMQGQRGGRENRDLTFGKSESLTTINFAPTPGTCPRCGK